MASQCPRCGAARGTGRYCSNCAFEFSGEDQAAAERVAAPRAAAKPRPRRKKASTSEAAITRWLTLGVLTILSLVGLVVVWGLISFSLGVIGGKAATPTPEPTATATPASSVPSTATASQSLTYAPPPAKASRLCEVLTTLATLSAHGSSAPASPCQGRR